MDSPPTLIPPPLRIRNPNYRQKHRLPHSRPILPRSESTQGLVPDPLFSKRITPDTILVTVLELSPATPIANPVSSPSSPSAPTSNWNHVFPGSSPPSSPGTRPRPLSSLSYSSSSSSSSTWITSTSTTPWTPPPPRPLRRKSSPRMETLRSLREKDSDACLQRIYERQTSAYLDGSMLRSFHVSSKLGREVGD
ncbi:hypothetical protein GQ43DRAFT_57423 [Delitschia confertaspora ATCC 74209]|uniref:Uncharacterized protein n=1 Tax=Delitschia confertaspora ATCC 74209 TaxID=1513339 RepID=A0A9P4JKK2_9PLEO|nr:hypothetical protein GQ43DRAFT_57423 [Delitschia confertaspora ATCC 74209]